MCHGRIHRRKPAIRRRRKLDELHVRQQRRLVQSLPLYVQNHLPWNVLTPSAVWSNFEIANMDFWRGEAYSKFFDYLDATGGFYYEVGPTFFSLFLWQLTCHLSDSVGVTHRCTASPRRCLRGQTRSTSSATWATSTTRTYTVRPTRPSGRATSAGAIPAAASVRFPVPFPLLRCRTDKM